LNLDNRTSTVILQLAHHQIYYLGKVGRKLRGISGREAVEELLRNLATARGKAKEAM